MGGKNSKKIDGKNSKKIDGTNDQLQSTPKPTPVATPVAQSDGKVKNKKPLRPNTVTGRYHDIQKRYEIHPKEIGHGQYGKVRIGTKKSDSKKYAVKTIPKNKVNDLETLRREITIMKVYLN